MKVYVVVRSETVTSDGFCKVFKDKETAERYMTGLMIDEIRKKISIGSFFQLLGKRECEGSLTDIIHRIYEECVQAYIEIFEEEVC